MTWIRARLRVTDDMDFQFVFIRRPTGSWLIGVEKPDSVMYRRKERPSDSYSTHRLFDQVPGAPGLATICWSRRIPTLAAARSVARAWSEGTVEYFRSASSF